MIHSALQAISKDLNVFLQRRLGLLEKDQVVILSELMNLDGSVALTSDSKLICTLLNIEQERTGLNSPQGNRKTLTNQPFHLNLYVLFSAFYPADNYFEALKTLSFTLAFFQGKQIFTPANTPGLDPAIEKLSLEIVNIDMKDLSNFWTALGAKHLPCVLFRIRMISISTDIILEEIPDIRVLDINLPQSQPG